MARENGNYLLKREFDEVEQNDGSVVYVERRPTLRSLGKPPWELEISDMWEGVIPSEATDLVGSVIWRGVRFTRGPAITRNKRMATSLDYSTDYDTTHLKDVYVNGIRFTRKDG